MKISQLIKFLSIIIDFTGPDKQKLQLEGLKEVRWIPRISVYKKIIRWNLLSEYLFWWCNFLFSSLALISQTLAVLSLWTTSHSNLATTRLCLQVTPFIQWRPFNFAETDTHDQLRSPCFLVWVVQEYLSQFATNDILEVQFCYWVTV